MDPMLNPDALRAVHEYRSAELLRDGQRIPHPARPGRLRGLVSRLVEAPRPPKRGEVVSHRRPVEQPTR